MKTLLEQHERARIFRREKLRLRRRKLLRAALRRVAPGEKVFVFGSLTRAGRYHELSDVDIAFVEEPKTGSEYRMQALLEELIHCPVDLVLLGETRLRDKIEREGELWI